MNQPALSVQLYAVNDRLTDDLDGTLARLSRMGLRHVEAFNFVTRPAELAEAFARHGLAAKTGHSTFLSDELRVRGTVRPVPAQRDVFEAAQTLGLDILIDAFVSPDRWLDEEQVAATADRLNQAAERAADYGLRVGYHNHTQEFAASFAGRSAFEVFAEQLETTSRSRSTCTGQRPRSRMCRLCSGVSGTGSRLCTSRTVSPDLTPPTPNSTPPLSTSDRPGRVKYRSWSPWLLRRPPNSP
jgi:hypothetical protein